MGIVEKLVEDLRVNDNQNIAPVNRTIGVSFMYSALSDLAMPINAEDVIDCTGNNGEISEVGLFCGIGETINFHTNDVELTKWQASLYSLIQPYQMHKPVDSGPPMNPFTTPSIVTILLEIYRQVQLRQCSLTTF